MSDSDLIKLYSQRILALAADIPHARRLDHPTATVRRRSPLCGSTVTVDIVVKDGKIADYGQDVKACALGQASAAVLGSAVIGRDRDQICAARDQLRAMLKNDADAPAAPFADLEALLPAREYPNRHASILLAWDATLEALDQALAAA